MSLLRRSGMLLDRLQQRLVLIGPHLSHGDDARFELRGDQVAGGARFDIVVTESIETAHEHGGFADALMANKGRNKCEQASDPKLP